MAKDKNKGKDSGKDQDSQATPEEIIKGLQDQVKEYEQEIEKMQKELDSTREKKVKGEELIKALRNELKAMTEAMDKQGDAPKAPKEEEVAQPQAPGAPDALCGVCGTKFNSEEALIKDQTSRTYLSLRCPQCGKIQNAESAKARF